jgi:hypothetical protein
MPSWFGRKPEVKPTIASLRFDAADWTYHGEREPNCLRVWQTPDSDAVGVHFFDIAPNIPVCRTLAELCDFYRSGIKAAGAEMVECALEPVAGQTAIRVLMKAPQRPHGRLYQATYTVPFRDFSFVVKVQCLEHGITGVRETVLADKRMAAGEMPNVSGKGPLLRDWDPDAPEHDADFPTHPVSRARRILAHVARSMSLEEPVGRLPKFELPETP